MIVALVCILTNSKITPERLIDESFAARGYGVITASALPMKSFESPSSDTTEGLRIRLRNRWQVREHKTMPGVYVAQVPPHSELFTPDTSDAQSRSIGKPILNEPVSHPDWDALVSPGGAEVKVSELLTLYRIDAKEWPWIYLNRTLRLRIDRKRVPDPVALVAAATGAKIAKEGPIEFNPSTFQPLALASLKQSEKTATDSGRRVKLWLAAAAMEEIPDKQLRFLASQPGATVSVKSLRFAISQKRFIQSYFESEFGTDPSNPEYKRIMEFIDPDGPVAISLTTTGLGRLAFTHRGAEGWVVF